MSTMMEPPIRYSVGQEDFDPEFGARLRIFVDGEEQRQVVEYDCEAGTVLKNKLDRDGQVVLNDTRDGIVRETVRGTVTVTVAPA